MEYTMVLHTFVETKIKLMKKIFLFSLLLLSTQVVAQNFDDLVSRTMNGKLTPYDFNNYKNYLINIDTLDFQQTPICFKFNDVINVTNKANQLQKFFKSGKIISTQVYTDTIPNLEKYHITLRLLRHNRNYLVHWWFEGNDDKLSAITIVKK